MHGYLSLDIICSSKITVFRDQSSRKYPRTNIRSYFHAKMEAVHSSHGKLTAVGWFDVGCEVPNPGKATSGFGVDPPKVNEG